MKKPSRVVFISDKLQEAYDLLADDDSVKKAIRKVVLDLRQNAFCGTQIPKRLFPQEYVRAYGITNLWKCNLSKSWRLLYTVTPENEVELISAILEWFDHKGYSKRFGYKKQ
jgi:Txe/YoeB family toxin of Txe-Axe toxin-antitoxin module